MQIMTMLWNVIGIVSTIWIGLVLLFGIVSAITRQVSSTDRKKSTSPR